MASKLFKIFLSVFILLSAFNLSINEGGFSFSSRAAAQTTDIANDPFFQQTVDQIDVNNIKDTTNDPIPSSNNTPANETDPTNSYNSFTQTSGTNKIDENVTTKKSNELETNAQMLERVNSEIQALLSQSIEVKNKYGANSPEYKAIEESLAVKQDARARLEQTISKETDACSGMLGAISCTLKDVANVLTSGPLGWLMLILNGLILLLQQLASLLLGLVGSILDMSLKFTINIGYYINNFSNLSEGIVSTWVMIRDIFNILFIFSLLYVAINTILRIGKGSFKTMLPIIVAAAIFVNFSLPITRALVDISNVISNALYDMLTVNGSVSATFMQVTGLSDIISKPEIGSGMGPIIFGILTIIVLLVAIWAFLQVMLLLIARSAVIIMLMITSPVSIAGFILPATSKYANSWWKLLYEQLMVVPVFLLLMNVVLKIGGALSNINDLTAGGIAKAGESTLDFGPLFKYGLLIAFLLFTVKVTKSFSSVISNAITGYMQTGISWALGAATGGAASALSHAVGGIANKTSDERLAKLKERSLQGGVGGKWADTQLKIIDSSKKGTFDYRNTTLGKNTVDFVKDKTGINVAGPKWATNKSTYDKRIETSAQPYIDRIKRTSGLEKDPAFKAKLDNDKVELKKSIEEKQRLLGASASARRSATTEQQKQSHQNEIDRLTKEIETDNEKLTKLNKGPEEIVKEMKAKFVDRVEAKLEKEGSVPAYFKKFQWNKATSASPRKAIASKIRKSIGEKTKKEKLAEAALEVEKENKEKEAAEKGGEESKEAKPEKKVDSEKKPDTAKK